MLCAMCKCVAHRGFAGRDYSVEFLVTFPKIRWGMPMSGLVLEVSKDRRLSSAS